MTEKTGVWAYTPNDITVKTLYDKNSRVMLCPENDEYESIIVQNTDDLLIWGCITGIARKFNPDYALGN